MVVRLAKLVVEPGARKLRRSSVDRPLGDARGPRSGRKSFFDHLDFKLSDLLGISSGRSKPIG